ncbi:MAG TPA: type VI secretion system baseplate subunit TssE [Plasticicumulans sp.]|nr:type VI secretion system baseplate subunit TssE [Plasticicumulans sp.]
MAELTPQERLQPALLDRLIDDAPERHKETREQRVLSLNQLRESVLRDLAWLFNAGNHESVQSLDAWPQVARSVLNYGLPALSGRTASSVDIPALERVLADTIRTFEPRILPHTPQVRAVVAREQMNHNAIGFEIQGELWAQPVPLHLWLKTEIDLESGNVRIEPRNA